MSVTRHTIHSARYHVAGRDQWRQPARSQRERIIRDMPLAIETTRRATAADWLSGLIAAAIVVGMVVLWGLA